MPNMAGNAYLVRFLFACLIKQYLMSIVRLNALKTEQPMVANSCSNLTDYFIISNMTSGNLIS